MNNLQNKPRLLWVDWTKLIAIFMVCVCHMYMLFPSFGAQEEKLSLTVNLLQTIGILGVPLFVMTTGTLVLSKSFDSWNDVVHFYKKNLLSLYVTGAIWSVFYQVLATSGTSWTDILLSALFVRKPAPHLWYLRMILIYYLFMPFLSYIFQHRKDISALLLLFSMSIFVVSGMKMLVFRSSCPTTPGWSMAVYLTYLFIGFRVCHLERLVQKSFCLFLFLLSVGALVLIRHCGMCSFLWYDNPLVLSASASLFLLLHDAGFQSTCPRAVKWAGKLSAMTFGVYLSHYAVLLFVVECQPSLLQSLQSIVPDTITYVLMLVLCSLCTLVLSFLFVRSVMCIPFFSRLLVRI